MENKALAYFKANIGKMAADSSPSPLGKWLNGKLLAAEEGRLTWEFLVRKEMTNPLGVLHGGIVSAILDDVMGATVFSLGRPEFYTSINLNVDFLSSAREGDVLIATAEVIRQGSNVIYITGQVERSGKTLARATSNLIKVSK